MVVFCCYQFRQNKKIKPINVMGISRRFAFIPFLLFFGLYRILPCHCAFHKGSRCEGGFASRTLILSEKKRVTMAMDRRSFPFFCESFYRKTQKLHWLDSSKWHYHVNDNGCRLVPRESLKEMPQPQDEKGVNDVTHLCKSVWKLNLTFKTRDEVVRLLEANLITFIAVLFKFYGALFCVKESLADSAFSFFASRW